MVCSLKLLILLQSVVLHKVIAMENRKLQVEENNLHKQLFHYETLKKSDISLHVRHHRDVDTGHVTARTYVTFFTLGMNFSMVLKAGSPVVAPGLRAYTVDRNGKYEPLHVDSNDFLTGHLQENESMHVYAHYEEDILCTTVYFPNEIYFTEPSWRHLPSSSGWDLISYRLSDVNSNHTGPFSDPLTLLQRPSSDESVSSDEQHQRFSRIRQKRQRYGLNKKCSLRLVADYSFYSQYARTSASEAIKIMVSSIEEVNRIYNHTEWKTPDSLGWGFVIKQVLVHTEYSKGPSRGPFSYNYEVDHWNTSDKLDAFSHHSDIIQFCLAHLFTHTLFKDSHGTVGLAYLGNRFGVGGICSMSMDDMYTRTGWTTSVYGDNYTILGIQHKLITAHELGHNWGSPHDREGECSPSDQQGGRYIMYPSSSPKIQINSLRFSPCSIDSISRMLRSVSQRCFIESAEDKIPCGNGVVDIREECDAGPDGLEGKDKCCSSICLLRENARCSDFNSKCCRNCTTAPAETDCKTDPDNQCIESSKCDGFTFRCPPSVPVANGVACQDNRVCFEGKCLSSCEVLQEETGMTYEPCQCQNDTSACKSCCKRVIYYERYDECFPTNTSLGFREPCYKGVCNEQGECVSEKDVPCGNGIVDEREECDVGKSVVKNQDKCCNGTCHLRESAQCSDFNKPCCKDCRIVPKGAVCEDNFELPCMESAKCDGVSTDCPSAVTKENGIACRGEGQCINGRCITTYCKELEKRIIGATEPACVIMTVRFLNCLNN
ncbi:ADAM 17-like protease [Pomacea canaliculata]|uniref:ADAM 17-like protease n=1 Tax=Pomacea canaliculata TaxID=400727 RepID=UPI000D73C6BA|nr:ADAM 17-like protease [Pomacea canaliculata]